MREMILSHARRYPAMRALDFAKLIYQSAFAGGHLIADADRALNWLKNEMEETKGLPCGQLYEPIGNGLCRLYLPMAAKMGLKAETICAFFVKTAEAFEKDKTVFDQGMDDAANMCEEGLLSIGAEEIRQLKEWCKKENYAPFSHSEAYRAAYAPSYRLVSEKYIKYLPVFAAIDNQIEKKGSARVAIDGMCASGKSTLGGMIASVYGAQLFHMDDFFLPFERKTKERLAQPGGNVDYERFQTDVLDHMGEEAFSYRPYDCGKGDLGEAVETKKCPVQVIEGSYCMHPNMTGDYDLRVFLSTSPEEQCRRILVRNGEFMHKRFINEWIPMENHYFEAFSIAADCDLIYVD